MERLLGQTKGPLDSIKRHVRAVIPWGGDANSAAQKPACIQALMHSVSMWQHLPDSICVGFDMDEKV